MERRVQRKHFGILRGIPRCDWLTYLRDRMEAARKFYLLFLGLKLWSVGLTRFYNSGHGRQHSAFYTPILRQFLRKYRGL